MSSAPPPGWYDDAGVSRWWDGQRWGPTAQAPETKEPASPRPAEAVPVPLGALEADPAGYTRLGWRRFRWLIAGCAAALLVVAAVVWLLVGRSGGDTEAASPEETVLEFIAAYKAGSCEGVTAVVTEHYLDESGSDCSEFQENPGQLEGVEVTLGEVSTNADGTVSVPVLMAFEGQSPSGDGGFTLIKVGDQWLIDDSW